MQVLRMHGETRPTPPEYKMAVHPCHEEPEPNGWHLLEDTATSPAPPKRQQVR